MPTISLPPRCDRAAAQALLPRMLAAQMPAAPMHIDARACVQIGQAVLQLLISARRSGHGAVIDASPYLRDTARRLGLTCELGLTP